MRKIALIFFGFLFFEQTAYSQLQKAQISPTRIPSLDQHYELASKSNDKKVKTLATQLNNHLRTFVGDQDYSKRDYNASAMTDAVIKGKKMLDELSGLLSQ